MTNPLRNLFAVCFTAALLFISTSYAEAQYCDAASSNTSDDWIAGVSFAGIENESGSTIYSDFTNISGTVVTGVSYMFAATIGNGGSWNQFVTIYIDWNQDEIFDEEGERYDIGNCASHGCTVVGEILVPDAIPGETRMRVIENYNGFVDESDGNACYTATFGEVEDYSLMIVGDCTPPSIVFETTDNCQESTFDVQATLADFHDNSVVTIDLNRSDIGAIGFIEFEDLLEGQTVDVITDVPFGVTVTATIGGDDPACNIGRTWNEVGLCPPGNNECETAVTITCGETISGSTTNASTPPEGLEYCSSTFAGSAAFAPAVWYKWTAPFYGLAFFSIDNVNFDSQHFIYKGTCDELECVDGADSPFNNIEFNVIEGETYYFMIGGWGTALGEFDINLDCYPAPCDFPQLSAVAVDADGVEIEGCVPVDAPVRVEVSLGDDAENNAYVVTVGDSSKVMTAPETHIFGSYQAGNDISVAFDSELVEDCAAYLFVTTEICITDNQECETAQTISCGQTVTGSTIGASDAPNGLDFCNGNIVGPTPSVWYALTLEETSIVSVTESNAQGPNGSFFDLEFFAYAGECGGPYTCVGGANTPHSFDFLGAGGETYYILVTGFNDSQGTFDLSVECFETGCDLPDITILPVDADGNEIEDCQEFGALYSASVTLGEGGEGNASWTVWVGDSMKVMTAPETHIFGNYAAGSTTDISIVGNDVDFCQVNSSISTSLCTPENNLCVDAEEIMCNTIVGGTTVGATQNPDQNYCDTAPPSDGNGGVWYEFNLTGITDVDIDLSGSEYDTKIFLYSGDCGALTCVTGNDDGGTDVDSRIQTQLEAGTYYIYVTGYANNRGNYEMSLSCTSIGCSPESITATPVDSEGLPIGSNCVDQADDYWVLVSIEGGNQPLWDASIIGGESIQILPNESGVLGPVSALETADVLVIGVENAACAGTALVAVELCPPSNDLPCDATALPTDGTVMTYTNVQATVDEGEVITADESCVTGWCDGAADNTVWFTFVGPESGRTKISLCGENSEGFDSQVAVWAVEDCANYATYTLIGANDDSACEIGGLISITEVCVEPGQTYYIQVDGWSGDINPFDIRITEGDSEVCNCVLPDLGEGDFTFIDTDPICDDPEFQQFSLIFYAPEDLGSQEGMLYTYDWAGNDGDPISIVVAGDPVTIPETFDPGTLIDVSVTITEEACEEAEGSIYPLSGVITLGFVNCDACSEIGEPCEDEDGLPGFWNEDCVCEATPENDLCENAIPIGCGDIIEGTTDGASEFGNPSEFCGTTTDAPGVWYTFIGTGSETTVSLCGSSYDTKLNVYTGTCGDLICETGNDDNFAACGPGNNSQVIFTSEFGVMYTVLVNGWNGDVGEFVLTLTCGEPADVSIEGSMEWNADCSNKAFTLDFYNPGTDVISESHTGMVSTDGTFSITEFGVGTFDIILTVEGYLAVGIEDVEVPIGGVAFDFGELIGGDINGDNGINIIDFSALNLAFGSLDGDANFNPYADINCDGGISIIDFSMLNVGFGMTGDSAGGE